MCQTNFDATFDVVKFMPTTKLARQTPTGGFLRMPAGSVVALTSVGFLGCGCASIGGNVNYQPPNGGGDQIINAKTFNVSKDALWPKVVSGLSKKFFVINNIDKSSGLINVSYSGDPEKYIDCGQLSSYVTNLRGERTYSFPAARHHETYEVMDKASLLFVDRTLNLDGRVNLIVEETSPSTSTITVNIKYIVQKVVHLSNPIGQTASRDDTISFGTGGSATFPAAKPATTCQATGHLEAEILSAAD